MTDTKKPLHQFIYKGFTIFVDGGRFQVRYFQLDTKTWHVFEPWCNSLREAKAVADKLLAIAGKPVVSSLKLL